MALIDNIDDVDWADPINKSWPPNDGLRLWILGANSQTGVGSQRARDLTKFENHGTLVGATWVGSERGRVLSFDGVDDYVSIDYGSIGSAFDTEWTICGWIYPRTAVFSRIFDKPFTSHASPFYQVQFNYDASQRIRSDITNTGGGAFLTAIAPINATPVGVWYHVAMRCDVSAPHLSTSINGEEVASDSTSSGTYANYNHGMALGRLLNTNAFRFDGLIDDFAVIPRYISDAELRQRWQDGRQYYPHSINRIELPSAAVQAAGQLPVQYFSGAV